MKKLLLSVLIAGLGFAGAANAKPGDAKRGAAVYAKRCVWCHGANGDGAGPATERMNPVPRDFTSGQYKIKTTTFDDFFPDDADLFRMIRDGMPGTGMPGWRDLLGEQDIWDLVAHVKTYAGLEKEKPGTSIDYGTQVPSSPESIEKGKQLFLDGDRCSECHGRTGKGDGVKGLKDDAGNRTWPRNLTKPWTFRASNDPKDIFTRITVGIPGTQMPSFADPASKKKLTVEERWHIANYVNSLAKTREVVRPENTVVKAERVEGEVPDAPTDPRWEQAEPTTFLLVPQIVRKDRFFTPSNDTITVRALYGAKEIALLLEWDDRTMSVPGDETAEKIADPDIAPDAVTVQLPVAIPEGAEKPYFVMGDAAHPVNVWRWVGATKKDPEGVGLANAKGVKEVEQRNAAAVGITATGAYKDGTWRVVMKRSLTTPDPEKDIQLVEGRFIPVAFAAWDGSNSERDSRHTLTTWYWLLLKPAASAKPLLTALVVVLLVALLEFLWVRGAARKAAGRRQEA